MEVDFDSTWVVSNKKIIGIRVLIIIERVSLKNFPD